MLNHLLNLLDLREIMLPGCHLPPLAGLEWTGGFLTQGFRWRSTPAYELAAPNGAHSLAADVPWRVPTATTM